MSKDRLKCPGCGGGLGEVYAEANYGRVLLLDQCAECGGVWFDRWELYFARPGSLLALHEMDSERFASPNPAQKGSNECPRCGHGLKPFIDPALPKDARIKRCEGCKGLWLNRGELGKYANHRAAMTGAAEGPARQQELKALKNLQKELDTSKLASSIEPAAFFGDEPPVETGEVLKDMGFLALQALVRLVFKF